MSSKGKSRSNLVGWASVGAMAALAAVLVVLLVSGSKSGSQEQAVPTDGPPAPDIALPDFYTGETVRLSDFRGEPLVVNYWASWCIPCLAELPGFERVHQRVAADVSFLGINIGDNPVSAQDVIDDTGITYRIVADVDGSTFAEFGAFAMPTTVFISPDGVILELFSGELSSEQLEDKVETYFGT